jgi:phospholipid/cholesterol/gamma-HCH transport system substrate-binding protein
MTAVRRTAAITAVVIAAVLLAIVLLAGGSPYTVNLRLDNASQLVKGNLVQVAGTKVGTVKSIQLTDDGQAQVKITVNDDYSPLHEGTRAVIRQASLSGIANRYVDLQQGPMTAPKIDSGATLPASATDSVVDIDQLFNIFDEDTRKHTRTVIKGFAHMTEGKTEQANEAIKYLNPVLSASQRLFSELDRNDDLLERFVVRSSQLVTDVADKREDLAGIVGNFGAVSTALAQKDTELADSVHRLPAFLRKANTTFVNLRATLDDLDPLVAASKPVVNDLRPLMADLRPFARDSAPMFRDLADAIRKPGKGNDLVELLRAQVPLDKAANDPVEANGAKREAAFPALAKSMKGSTPQTAFFRPYAVDLTGWFDDFSTSGQTDALGNFSRAGLALGSFTFTPAGQIVPVPPELRPETLTASTKMGRSNRCPGSIERDTGDHSVNWKPSADFNCDQSQGPAVSP